MRYVLVLCGVLACGCSEKPAARASGQVRVVVTVPPLAGLVRPLLPEKASVTMLMAPGRSEHGYEFTPGDIAAIGKADLVIYASPMLEPAVDAFLKKHPDSRRGVVCLAKHAGVPEGAEHDGHDHHSGPDPHIWLDPVVCISLVDAIEPETLDALRAAGDLNSAATVAGKAEKLRSDIQALDEEYKSRLAPFKGRAIVTHHNAWGRLAERYGLKVAAVMHDIDEGEMTPRAVADTVAAIRKEGAKCVFVEPQFDRAAAQRIAEQAGVKVAMLDPLGDGDWFKMMRANLEALVEGLGP